MNTPETPKHRTSVSLNDIQTKVKKTVYTVLPDTTTTVCQLFMENGYVILGTSACVDPAKYNKALGEKYAYEDAINKAWPLEGYLLAEEIFRRKPSHRAYEWRDVAKHERWKDYVTGGVRFGVVMKDGSAFEGMIHHDPSSSVMSAEEMIVININRQLSEREQA